jgi:hypothetical protein
LFFLRSQVDFAQNPQPFRDFDPNPSVAHDGAGEHDGVRLCAVAEIVRDVESAPCGLLDRLIDFA